MMYYCNERRPYINKYFMMSINQITEKDLWDIDNNYYPKAVFLVEPKEKILEWNNSLPIKDKKLKHINLSKFLLLL